MISRSEKIQLKYEKNYANNNSNKDKKATQKSSDLFDISSYDNPEILIKSEHLPLSTKNLLPPYLDLPKRNGNTRGAVNPYLDFGDKIENPSNFPQIGDKSTDNSITIAFHHIIPLNKFNAILMAFFQSNNNNEKIVFLKNIKTTLENIKLKKSGRFIVESLDNLIKHIEDPRHSIDEEANAGLKNILNYAYFNGFAGPDEKLRPEVLQAKDNKDRLSQFFIDKNHYKLLRKLEKNYEILSDVEKIYTSDDKQLANSQLASILVELSIIEPTSIVYNPKLWGEFKMNNKLYFSPINTIEDCKRMVVRILQIEPELKKLQAELHEVEKKKKDYSHQNTLAEYIVYYNKIKSNVKIMPEDQLNNDVVLDFVETFDNIVKLKEKKMNLNKKMKENTPISALKKIMTISPYTPSPTDKQNIPNKKNTENKSQKMLYFK